MRRREDRERLGPGKHAILVKLPGGAARLSMTIVVGREPGPRAFLIGGLADGDPFGIGVARGVVRSLDPDELSGSLIVVPRAAPPGTTLERDFTPGSSGALSASAKFVWDRVVGGAAFGVEVRAGAPGWLTFPHARADLSDRRVRKLVRAATLSVVVDAAGLKGSLRRAATEAGVPTVLLEGNEAGWAQARVTALLGASGMLPRAPRVDSDRRIVIGEITRVRAARGAWSIAAAPPGSIVAKGEPLAESFDEVGRSRAVVSSPSRGFVLGVPSDPTRPRTAARLGKIRSISSPGGEAPAASSTSQRTIGWSEWVALPDLGVERLRAKIDTGARTSALHVTSMRQVGEEKGRPILELQLPAGRWPRGGRAARTGTTARVVVEGYLVVRDSGGHAERRPLIQTSLALGDRIARVPITLTDRGDMLFPMLIGRTAVEDGVVVDPNRRDLLGERR